MCVLIFSTIFLGNIFHSNKIQRDTTINVHRSSYKVLTFIVIFKCNLNLLGRVSQITQIIKFHENPSSGSQVVPCGRTDRHDEAKYSLFAILPTRLKICYFADDIIALFIINI